MSATLARDSGLLRRIGPLAFGAAIVNGVVGAGIFTLPASMASAAGALAPLAYVLCAVAMGAVVVCFAEAGSRLPTSGGAYGYVEEAFGKLVGFIAGMLTYSSCVLACGGIASAFASSVGRFAPALSGVLAQDAVILVAIGAIVLVNLRGVDGAARLVSVGTAIKLLPLGLFLVVGVLALPGTVANAAPAPASDFGRAIILALFAFCGMETSVGASGEVANPNRSVPLALFGAMGFVLVLYVSVQLVAQRLLGSDLVHAVTPLSQAAGRVSHGAGVVLIAGASLSMLIWIATDILGAPRILFAFARDGVLPGFLGRVNARSHVPATAIVVHAAIAAGLAVSGDFTGLVVASTLSTGALYFLACAASWVLHRRGTAMAGRPFTVRALPVAAVIGMASMVALVCMARLVEVAGLAAIIVASAALFWVMRLVGRGQLARSVS